MLRGIVIRRGRFICRMIRVFRFDVRGMKLDDLTSRRWF